MTAPGALPLLGHSWQLLRDPLGFLNRLSAHGPVVQVRIGTYRAFVVCEPKTTRQMLLNDRVFDKGGVLFERIAEVLGNGVVVCPHAEHRRQRQLTQQAFRASRLPGYSATMLEQITKATRRWHEDDVIDVSAQMQTLTAHISLATMFGSALTDEQIEQLNTDLKSVLAGIYRRAFLPPPLDRLPTPGNRRYHRARGRLDTVIDHLITRYRAAGTDRGDLLSMLLNADAPTAGEHRRLSDTELRDQVITFFTGGMEPPANTLAWALYLVAGDHRLRQRLEHEVDTVLSGRPLAVEDLPRLRLSRNIITETLRLYPPGWLITRRATTATELAGYPIEAGTTVAYSPYLIHRLDSHYTDPERFDPDRWAEQGSRSARTNSGEFLAFGAGPRQCMGDVFGLTETTLALAHITAGWRLQPLTRGPVRPGRGLSLHPPELTMRLHRRTPADHTTPGP